MRFAACIGVDYSGAATPRNRLPGIAVYWAGPEAESRPVAAPGGGRWTREGLADWLGQALAGPEPVIAGLDFAFSFPAAYFERYALPDWDAFLADFRAHWPTDEPGATVEALREGSSRTGDLGELRLCETWTAGAKSVFRFDFQGAVAKSAHAGIPWLHRLRRELGDRVHFWPFDGFAVPAGRSVLAEVYPALFKRRYPRGRRDDHQQDAYAVARWLREAADRGILGRYLEPPLTAAEARLVREREGWILGVA